MSTRKATLTYWIKPSVHFQPTPTVTQIDFVTSTIYVSPTAEPSVLSELEDVWEHRIHKFLPVLLAFAIIGILTVLGSLIYLVYRLYQAHRHKRRQTEIQFDAEKPGSPISATLTHIIPWLSIPSPRHPTDTSDYQPQQREPIRYEKSDFEKIIKEDGPQRRPSWLSKFLPKPTRRHVSLPILFSSNDRSIDNLDVPISSTFVPIDTSSLTLVPRSEIWSDPTRRRGVDEVDMWERKNSATQTIVVPTPPLLWRFPNNDEAYPDSPETLGRRFSEPEIRIRSSIVSDNEVINEPSSSKDITVKLPKSKKNHVLLARQQLEQSKLQNSSSQWLYPSGSKSF